MKHIKTHNDFIGDHIIVEFEIFTLCDKSCSYCYNIPNNGPRFNNSIDDVLEGLKRIIDMDNKKIIIELIGGEPILHKHFEEIIDFIYKNKHEDHKLIIFTHADHPSHFFNKRIDLLKKFEDKVRISCSLHLEELNKDQYLRNIKYVDKNFKHSDLYIFTDNRYLNETIFIEKIMDSVQNMKIFPLILDNSNVLDLSYQIVNLNTKFEKYSEKMNVQYEIDGKIIPYNKAKYLMYKFNRLSYTGQQCRVRAYEIDRWGDITMSCFQNGQEPLGNIFNNPSTALLNSCSITCTQKRCNPNLVNFEVTIGNDELL